MGISGLPFGSLGTKSHLDVAPVERCKKPRERGGGQQPLQSLDKFKKYMGGKKTSHNGGVVLPEDVQMKPFNLEGFSNFILSVKVHGGHMGINRLPGGHADLDHGHPGLL